MSRGNYKKTERGQTNLILKNNRELASKKGDEKGISGTANSIS